MSHSVERVVAEFLGTKEVDWEKLKPVMCFVVLWNRLEVQHGQHLNPRKLEASSRLATVSPTFDISPYSPHVNFFQERYRDSPLRLSSLLRTRQEPDVKRRIDNLITGELTDVTETLLAVLMVPYRIRNNLFHGRKETSELYSQTDLFAHANEVLCQFHADLYGCK